MPRPQVTSMMTTSNVARELGMGSGQVISWIEHDALPKPTKVDGNGVRYFDDEWLKKAREIVNKKKNDN